MEQEAVVIPDRIYFKIGEVCDLVGVQAHVLRYWETEFSALSPQKNKSGQRSYRKRDVEIALRIKQLLYNEMFTIAGARKKLQNDLKEASRPKDKAASAAPTPKPPAAPIFASREPVALGPTGAPLLFDAGFATDGAPAPADHTADIPISMEPSHHNGDDELLRSVAKQLVELRNMLTGE